MAGADPGCLIVGGSNLNIDHKVYVKICWPQDNDDRDEVYLEIIYISKPK